MTDKKCIVFGCSNKQHEGKFVGDICAPCYEYITTGKVGCTNSFLKQLKNSNSFEEVFKRIKLHMHYRYNEWYIVDIVNSPSGKKYPSLDSFEHEYIDTVDTFDDEHTGFIYLPYLYQYIKIVYYA